MKIVMILFRTSSGEILRNGRAIVSEFRDNFLALRTQHSVSFTLKHHVTPDHVIQSVGWFGQTLGKLSEKELENMYSTFGVI